MKNTSQPRLIKLLVAGLGVLALAACASGTGGRSPSPTGLPHSSAGPTTAPQVNKKGLGLAENSVGKTDQGTALSANFDSGSLLKDLGVSWY